MSMDLTRALQTRDEAIAGLRQALDVAGAELSRLRAENAQLRAELDAHYPGRTVLLVPGAGVHDAMRASIHEADGTILRDTVSGQEWELRRGAWYGPRIPPVP